MPVLSLTQADNGRSFEVAPGDEIVVRLEESPTTGYQWVVEGGDDEVLALQSSDFSLAAGTGLGGGGERTLSFKAKRAGTARLQLKLWRDWEGESSTINRFEVTVRVGS